MGWLCTTSRSNFYPRPPRGGRRAAPSRGGSYFRFLSTPSARRATDPAHRRRHHRRISIHALREEGDSVRRRSLTSPSYFYPRPPRGGRPEHAERDQHHHPISIHALREEGDLASSTASPYSVRFLSTPSARRATRGPRLRGQGKTHFYPRPPRGGRR